MGDERGDIATRLPTDATSPRQARRFVAAALRRWDCTAAVDTAVLLTAEVVTNAVLHARSEIEVRVIRADGYVRVEVADRSADPPALRHYPVDAATGRGLQLVAALSARWGTTPHADGKCVWFEVPA